jgi:hypothetical protein
MEIGKNSVVIDRGMALHKMIRLISFSLGGEVINMNKLNEKNILK